MKASVQRTPVARLTPGSKDTWGMENTVREQSRTTRKQLFEEFKRHTSNMSSNIETSMTVGASFPVKAVSVSAEASTSFSHTVETGVETSSTKIGEYESENISDVTQMESHKYTPNPAGGAVKIVFKEEWKLGDTIFRVVYLNCDEPETKEKGWPKETEDVTMDVGVDRQWYHVKNGNGEYLSIGKKWSNGYHFLEPKTLSEHSYDQQWTLAGTNLMTRSGKWAACMHKGLFCLSHYGIEDPFKAPFSPTFVVRGTQINDGFGYCLSSHSQLLHGFPKTWIRGVQCGGQSATKQWSFNKVVSNDVSLMNQGFQHPPCPHCLSNVHFPSTERHMLR